MKNKFIISDLHFGHENIIKYCNRPFSSAEEMDAVLIENWNKIVKPNDRVYLAGDISIGRKHIQKVGLLNGKKVLIKGNHDIFKLKDYLPYFEDIRGYTVTKDGYIISHIPIYVTQQERFKGNIHGHFHDKRIMLPESNLIHPFYYNISVECIDYTPILLEEAINNLKQQYE